MSAFTINHFYSIKRKQKKRTAQYKSSIIKANQIYGLDTTKYTDSLSWGGLVLYLMSTLRAFLYVYQTGSPVQNYVARVGAVIPKW